MMCLNKKSAQTFLFHAGFIWGVFAGCTRDDRPVLRVLAFKDRHSAALKAVIPEFEKKVGIKVKFDEIPAESVATKMMTDLAGGGTYDVYTMDEPFLTQFSPYLLPVSQWPEPEESERNVKGDRVVKNSISVNSVAEKIQKIETIQKNQNSDVIEKTKENLAIDTCKDPLGCSDGIRRNVINDALSDDLGLERFGLEHFEAKALEASQSDGVLMGLPVNGNVYQYIYRKDLLESPDEKAKFLAEFGRPLAPAKNFAELLELAQFFYRPPMLYGFAPFTKMSEGTTVELLWLLAGFGITPFTESPELAQIEKALDFYQKLLSFSPKAAKSWHHTERMSAYAKGKVAQMMTWNSFFLDLEDDNKSLVVSKTGFAPSPEGFRYVDVPTDLLIQQNPSGKNRRDIPSAVLSVASKSPHAKLPLDEKPPFQVNDPAEVQARDIGQNQQGSFSYPTSLAGTWIAGVRKDSKQARGAAAFIGWWTSRAVNERLLARGLSTARKDLLTNPEMGLRYPWFEATHLNFDRAMLRPRHRDYKLVSHKLSKAFTRLIASQTDLKTASLEIREAMVDMNKLVFARNSPREVR